MRHFLALATIADTGRLAHAADRLHLSQSALTQALRKMERFAGAALFERSGFGVTPTRAGKALIRRSRRAVELITIAERELQATALHRHATTSQLRALIAVVDTGGYSTAARRLGLAQPTVHRAARQLERYVGRTLLERSSRGVTPSEAARTLARYSNLVFAEVRQGFEEIRETQGRMATRIAVGSLPLVRSEFLPAAVTRLLATYPEARVSILEGPYVEQLDALRSGEIDWLLGALRDPAPTSDIVQEALFEQPLGVVVRPGHPLLDGPSPSIETLAKLDWVAPRALAPTRGFFDAFFAEHGVTTPTRIIECSSLVATRSLLLQSDRAAMLSPLQTREDVNAGELAVLIDAVPDSNRTIGMTTRNNWEPTRVQAAFADILRKFAAETA